jgi:hypothetical protein
LKHENLIHQVAQQATHLPRLFQEEKLILVSLLTGIDIASVEGQTNFAEMMNLAVQI